MSKKFVAIIAGLVVAAGFGSGVDAGISINRMITPPTQTIDASESLSVTYSDCTNFETIVFEFEGETQSIDCDALPPLVNTALVDRTQGLRAGPLPETLGSATATFTGPAIPGDYGGIAYVTQQLELQGIRGPAAAGAALTANRVAQVTECDGQFDCLPFEVIVQQAPTTTEAPAPTTTEAAVVPPVPTTVPLSPSLPATGPSQNDNTVTIAIALLLGGGALILVTRWRNSHSQS